jgi:RHS repeat-associated protein
MRQTSYILQSFGMGMFGRSSGNEYAFGFNGKRDEKEVANGVQDFGARMYDTKLARWMSTDPKKVYFSSWSPYNYVLDNPILFTDPDGKIPWPTVESYLLSTGKTILRYVASGFGMRTNKGKTRPHNGLDINLGSGSQDLGIPVYATHDGIVTRVRGIKDDKNEGGNRIAITSADGSVKTVYMHLREKPEFNENDRVAEGQIIGYIGGSASGEANKTAVHLHYELWTLDGFGVLSARNPYDQNGEIIDPQLLLNIDPLLDFYNKTISFWIETTEKWFDMLKNEETGSGGYKQILLKMSQAQDEAFKLIGERDRYIDQKASDFSNKSNQSDNSSGDTGGVDSSGEDGSAGGCDGGTYD